MTNTANLGMPFIEASQAQKHVTHNEALRILDAVVQISVLDLTRTSPPSAPADGERHVVAAGATGAWVGRANAIATWQDGAWAFLAPHAGWFVWSVADTTVYVFDGLLWRDLRSLSVNFDSATRLGINTTASAPNLLSVKSNAALFAAITAANGGSGDVRVQLSKESAAKTASLFFADNFSGRAEFGLVGSDAFKLKVSADGATWIEALAIDQASGNLAMPRGLVLSGVAAPPQIAAHQNDYNPVGIGTASVLQLSADAARNISGLAGGAEGRILCVINVGGQPITLLDESAASAAANRFTLGGSMIIPARQAVILRYDGTAARWQAIAGATGLRASNNLSDLASASAARGNLGILVPPQGRLTLQSGVAVMTTAQAAKTTLYYTPYAGNQIPIYDGVNMVPTAFPEIAIAITDTIKNPAAIGANKVNDWFVWNDSGTPRLSHGPDWSSDTARSAGTALIMVSGILLNNAAIINGPAAQRGTYVGTTRSNGSSVLDFVFGSSATGGGQAYLAVWNMYNRVNVATMVSDATASWSYSSATARPMNASATNRVSFVSGLAEDAITATVTGRLQSPIGGGTSYFQIGMALDAPAALDRLALALSSSASRTDFPVCARNSYPPQLGFHFIQATEKGDGTNSWIINSFATEQGLFVDLRM